jgi:hypothetical protein
LEARLFILVGRGQGESFNLASGKEYNVGRHSENDIQIEDDNISRNHLKIKVKGDKYFITDLDSKNGTFVGGKDLSPGIATEVKEGVPIVIGMTILGLGDMCELFLKSYLDSAGFKSETGEYDGDIELYRVMTIKKNLEFVYNITYSLMKSKSVNEISKIILINIFNLFSRIDRCVIVLVNNQTGEFDNIIYRSRKVVEDPKKVYSRELVEHALRTKKPVMVRDSDNAEDGDEKVTESLQLMKIRSAMCVPIVGCYGIKGAIYIDSIKNPNGFRKSDVDLLMDVSGRAAVAMDSLFLQASLLEAG